MFILVMALAFVIISFVTIVLIEKHNDAVEARRPKPPKTGASLNDLCRIAPSFAATQRNINESFEMIPPIIDKWERIKKLIG